MNLGQAHVNGKRDMKRTPWCIFPLICYFMATMALCFEFLPREALAIFGETPDGDTSFITFPCVGVFLLLGVILHLVLYRLNPERFDVRAFRHAGIGMLCVLAAFFVLSSVLDRFTGLPAAVLRHRVATVMAWGGLIIVGGTVLVLALLFVGLIVSLRFHPANRMARRLAVEDFAGAVRIGEAHMRKGRDFTTCVNLVHAYALSGQTGKARELLAVLERTEGVPEHYTEETFSQTLDSLRKSIDLDPRNVGGPELPTATDLQGGA